MSDEDKDCGVAQPVVQAPVKGEVGGSNPSSTAIHPTPRLFCKDNKVYVMMEHNGLEAWERIPRQFLKLNDMQRQWYIRNLQVVPKLYKKLKIKLPEDW